MGWGWWGRWRCVVARHQNPYCFRGDNNTRYVLRIPKIFIFFPRGKEWVVCATYTKHISRHTDSNQTKCFLHIRGEETPLSCNPSTKCKSHGHSPLVPRHYLRPTSLPRLRLGSSLLLLCCCACTSSLFHSAQRMFGGVLRPVCVPC